MLVIYYALSNPWIQPIIWCLCIIPNPEDDMFIKAPLVDEYGWGSADHEVEPEVGELAPEA